MMTLQSQAGCRVSILVLFITVMFLILTTIMLKILHSPVIYSAIDHYDQYFTCTYWLIFLTKWRAVKFNQ